MAAYFVIHFFTLIRPTAGILVFNILLNFADGSEVRKPRLALKQKNIKFDRHYERGLYTKTSQPKFN